MRGPPRMAPGRAQHGAHGSVGGNRIGHWRHAAKPQPPLRVGAQHRPPLHGSAGPLHVVEAFGIGLPHVDHRIGDGLAVAPAHGGLHEQRLAHRASRDVAAQRQLRRAGHMEGAEHGGLGGLRALGVVHGHREHRQAQGVRQQDELLALRVALLARGGEEVDARGPLGLGEPHFAREVVQVAHQRRQHFLQPCVLAAGHALEHGGGDGVFIDVAHGRRAPGGKKARAPPPGAAASGTGTRPSAAAPSPTAPA
ncbi:hypothetical protein D9M69_466730 [compost metagenome]